MPLFSVRLIQKINFSYEPEIINAYWGSQPKYLPL